MGRLGLIFFFCTLLLLPFSLASPVEASDRLVVADFSTGTDAKGTPAGWHLKEKTGKADFSIVTEGGIHALRLRSAKTSFALQRGVDVNPRHYPLLTWKWKVTKLPTKGDFRKSKSDDQAAQIFVAFSDCKAIAYLWDSTAPEGSTGDAWSPPFMKIKAIVLRSGHEKVGTWLAEKRNVMEDYKTLFGREPPEVAGVRIQINSQHTVSAGESYFADLVFERQ